MSNSSLLKIVLITALTVFFDVTYAQNQLIKTKKIHLNIEDSIMNSSIVILRPRISLSSINDQQRFKNFQDSLYLSCGNLILRKDTVEEKYYRNCCYYWYQTNFHHAIIYDSVNAADYKIIYNELDKINKLLADSIVTTISMSTLLEKTLQKYTNNLCILTCVDECTYIGSYKFGGFPYYVLSLERVYILDVKDKSVLYYNSAIGYHKSSNYKYYKSIGFRGLPGIFYLSMSKNFSHHNKSKQH